MQDLQDQITALQAQVGELYVRMDLDPLHPNTYANDGSVISNDLFTLTRVDNGDGTFTVVRS